MSLRAWRTAHASVIGTSHLASGTECQDAARCAVVQDAAGADVLIAAVSDGAGSAPRSSAGATLATDTFLDAMSDAIGKDTGGLAFLDRRYVEGWLFGLLAEIAAMADREGRAVGDYACTFLAAVVSDACACFLQVGDGAIVASRPGEAPQWIFWPQHGEFANSTFFVTQQGVADVLMFSTCRQSDDAGPVERIAIFSDGLERLVLNFATETVHAPALDPIFQWLAGTEPSDEVGPSGALVAYLGSQHVNRRTDDDKTLVLATRAPPAVAIPAGGDP